MKKNKLFMAVLKMINIYELSLLDLLPISIKTKEIETVCKVLDKQLSEISEILIDNIIFPRIDELPENTIDLLAWQLHVDFYEPLELYFLMILRLKNGLHMESDLIISEFL